MTPDTVNTDREFAGRVVCIAGASQGIGRSLASAFAERRASLALLARSPEIQEVGAELSSSTDVLPMQCDVSDYRAVEKVASAVHQRWGRIDVLINVAAILGATGPLWTSDPLEWASAVNVNLIGTYHTMRAFLPAMIEARQGKIINFAGGGAAYGYPTFSAYAASKVAVVRLTETLAAECASYNVQANAVAPGAIETQMLKAVRKAGGEVRTLGSIDLVINLAVFLASSCSDHISGRFIHAKDGYQTWQGLNNDAYTLRRVEIRA